MRLPGECLPYLFGKEFSNGIVVRFDFEEDDRDLLSRVDVLKPLCSGKRIIHVGCVDHDVQSIEKKIKIGTWLHGILNDISERCYGVDINSEGIQYLRDKLGFNEVAAGDIVAVDSPDLMNSQWDYLLLPEVLEHVNNPVDFLDKINIKFRQNVNKIIITVPNAFSEKNHIHATKGSELINSDHRYWFTPFTLSKIVMTAGLRVEKIIMCNHGFTDNYSFLNKRFYKKHPLLRRDIVLIAEFS